jgi:hypothetical protein
MPEAYSARPLRVWRGQRTAGVVATKPSIRGATRSGWASETRTYESASSRNVLMGTALNGWLSLVRAASVDPLEPQMITQDELKATCLRALARAAGSDAFTATAAR